MLGIQNMGPYGIEVFRLPLRDTVNEGEDADPAWGTIGTADRDARPPSRPQSRRGTMEDDPARLKAALSQLPPTSNPVSPPSAPTPPQRTSQKVVLLTRPSQRDIEQWTERATSTMVRSAGGSVRLVTSTQQSKRWVLQYKPVVSHSGWLIKRGHSIRNFKRRLFCILDHELVYHDSHDSTEVRGRVDLRKRTTVQCLLHSGFRLSQGSYQMVLYASDSHDRDVWMKSLLDQGVEQLPTSAKTAKLIEQQSSNAEKNPILFSGWLRKRGQMVKSTKRRWFELSNSTLSYYSHPQGGTKKGSLDITRAHISHVDTLKTGERFSFVVRTRHRDLILHADSQEERQLWVASLSSVSETSGSISGSDATDSFISTSLSVAEIGRRCSCNPGSVDESGSSTSLDGCCRRCMASFISKTEDALLDVAREVQLILASPYSPEGSTTAAFLKEHGGKPLENGALRQFMSGLADYMVHTRLNELRVLGGRPSASHVEEEACVAETDDSSEFTEQILTIINEQIEERVFFPLYRAAHHNIKEQTRADSKLLRGKIEILQSKAQSFFGIGPESMSVSSWESACTQLKEVDKVSLPYMKRNQIVAACKEIYAVYHQEHPSNPPMNADEFIPAFIFVLVQSKLSDPVLLKELVTFFDLGGTQGEAAYFVTCLEIALEYIRSLVIACTVVLDATQKLGIEFARDPEHDVAVVNRLVRDGQADQSQAVHIGDVLVAINGLLVYEMELSEITKMVAGIDGAVELCLLPMHEYEQRFGGMKRAFSGRDDDNDDTPTRSDTGPSRSHSAGL